MVFVTPGKLARSALGNLSVCPGKLVKSAIVIAWVDLTRAGRGCLFFVEFVVGDHALHQGEKAGVGLIVVFRFLAFQGFVHPINGVLY